MKNIVAAAIITVTWCAAAPFAQEQAERASNPPAHNVFVLTGCVESAVEGATPSFRLTDAASIGQPPPAGAATTGGVGTAGQKASYELWPVSGLNAQGLDADALKAHVGRRVEMVVRPVESSAPPPPAASAGAGPVEPTAPERFSVTEIKRVIGSCS